MKVTLLKVNPRIKPKPQAFADFRVEFSGGEIVIIKGVCIKFYKGKIQIILPRLKHPDAKKGHYSPFLFSDENKTVGLLFAEKAKKEIVFKYPLEKWNKGPYVANRKL